MSDIHDSSTSHQEPFRILSLDGGGMRGAITAQILMEVEKQLKAINGKSLHQYFDMIAGTSTGSILTAGIAIGKKSEKLLNVYKDKGHVIFPPNNKIFNLKFLKSIKEFSELFFKSKYQNTGLIETLQQELGEQKIRDIKKPIMLILAYDMYYRNTTFFTNCHPDFKDGDQEKERWFDGFPLWEICVSSSSAPTFLPPYNFNWTEKDTEKDKEWEFPHIDGGVSANNPSLAAISQAIKLSRSSNVDKSFKKEYKLEDLNFKNIFLLSVGTGRSGLPYGFKEINEWRGFNWIKNIPDVFMEPSSEITDTICQNIMGKNYLRLQFDLNKKIDDRGNKVPSDEVWQNQFLKEKLSEDMSDSKIETVNKWINATKIFLKEGEVYYSEIYKEELKSVTEAIKEFINLSSTPVMKSDRD